MPPRKAPATNSKQSERLALAQAISAVATKQDAFVKAVETLEQYRGEILVNMDLEIETKKRELEDLKESLVRKQKDGKIDTDQFLREYKRRGAVQILQEGDEVPVKKARYEEMEEEIAKLRKDRTEEIEALRKEEREHAKRNTNLAVRNCELTHKAESAETNAAVKQQEREIASLQSTIENLKVELSEQRKLTKDVAEASRAAPITLSAAGK